MRSAVRRDSRSSSNHGLTPHGSVADHCLHSADSSACHAGLYQRGDTSELEALLPRHDRHRARAAPLSARWHPSDWAGNDLAGSAQALRV